MTDVHVYFNRPADKEDADLEDLKESLVKLEHVSEVRFDPSGNVVAVSFEGGEAEQEAIERAVANRHDPADPLRSPVLAPEPAYSNTRIEGMSSFDRSLFDAPAVIHK